jgi:hypothetical protein
MHLLFFFRATRKRKLYMTDFREQVEKIDCP